MAPPLWRLRSSANRVSDTSDRGRLSKGWHGFRQANWKHNISYPASYLTLFSQCIATLSKLVKIIFTFFLIFLQFLFNKEEKKTNVLVPDARILYVVNNFLLWNIGSITACFDINWMVKVLISLICK